MREIAYDTQGLDDACKTQIREADDACNAQMREIENTHKRQMREVYAANDNPVDSDKDIFECRQRELSRERFAAYECRKRKVGEAYQRQTREDKVNLAKHDEACAELRREIVDARDRERVRERETEMRENQRKWQRRKETRQREIDKLLKALDDTIDAIIGGDGNVSDVSNDNDEVDRQHLRIWDAEKANPIHGDDKI